MGSLVAPALMSVSNLYLWILAHVFFFPSYTLFHIDTVTVNLGAARYNHSILLKPLHSANGHTVRNALLKGTSVTLAGLNLLLFNLKSTAI